VNDCVRGIHSNVLALKYARRGDYRTAARIWLRASKSRFCDAKILFNLAICYQNGLGITKDLAKVIHSSDCHSLFIFSHFLFHV